MLRLPRRMVARAWVHSLTAGAREAKDAHAGRMGGDQDAGTRGGGTKTEIDLSTLPA